MKIIIEEKASREDEDTIIVRCASLNESILKLLQQLKAGDELITCTQNGTIARIRPDDVYYFESVDNKTSFSIRKKRCMKYGRSCMKSKTAMPDLISSAAQNRLL